MKIRIRKNVTRRIEKKRKRISVARRIGMKIRIRISVTRRIEKE